MFKKFVVTFIIVSLLSINIIEPVLINHAQAINVAPPVIPDFDKLLDDALFKAYDKAKFEKDLYSCLTEAYKTENQWGWLLPAAGVIGASVCQGLGRDVLGFTAVAGMCVINVGGADTFRMCVERAQQLQDKTQAKRAEKKKLTLQYVAYYILDRIVDDLVQWIAGYEGKPQFVTNWRKFFSDVADETLGIFIENSPFSDLCEPFRLTVRIGMKLPGKPPFPTCTLSKVINNIESFYEDFSSGGWLAFEESFYPWNNAFGAYLMAQEALNAELTEAREEAEKKTQSGYLPTEYCLKTSTDPATGEKKCEAKIISMPGEVKLDLTGIGIGQQLKNVADKFINSSRIEDYLIAIAQALITRLVSAAKNQKIGGQTYGTGLLKIPDKATDVNSSSSLKYACNDYGGYKVCEVSGNGIYTSMESCEAACKTQPYRYTCNIQSGICAADINGIYSTYEECEETCGGFKPSVTPTPPTETRYSCNEVEGICEIDPNGDFATLGSCQKYCGSEPTPPPQY